ncbi:MAG TPA: hypothetical protein VFP49_08090, partial [Nitrososphaeraceae archaeon]|nr:hypothetical protein [Nitrososphaeraceae archaeon]
MWNFFRFKYNEKNKNTKKNSKAEVEEEESEEDNLNPIDSSNEYNKNIFSIVDFPERITQINKAYPLLKQKEKIVL